MSIRTKLLIATSIAAVSFSAAAFAEKPVEAVKGAVVETKTTEVKKVEEVKKEITPAAETKSDAKKAEEVKKEVAPAVKH
jgi:hypothetical protein